MSDEIVRTRTYSWSDPAEHAKAAAHMSKREFFEAMRDGKLPHPPVAAMMGMRIVEVGEGWIVWAMEPEEYHYNPLSMVHGGVIATLLDSAMACAILTLLPQDASAPTLELKTNYIRAMTHDTGPVRCEGKVIHCGRQTAVAEGRVVDATGKLFAHATTTCLIVRA